MESWSTNSSGKNSGKAERQDSFIFRLRGDRMPGVLQPEFYERETLAVARDLLGKVIIVRSDPNEPFESPKAQVTVGRIVETEGYHGQDPASHSSRGPTPRCSVMFGDPGVAYVYFIYGMYEMLNFVTESKGYPGAVLIRAAQPLGDEKWLAKRRPGVPRLQWMSGPGKLCRAMGIQLSHSGTPLQGPEIFVIDDGFRTDPRDIYVSPRVGIQKAKDEPWRYYLHGNPFVSKVKENTVAKRYRP